MPTIEVLTPVTRTAPAPRMTLAPRGALPDGAHLTLVSNGKPKARELLELLADELRGWLDIGEVELFSKPTAAFPIEPAAARELAGRSHAVIAAIGDCGACSACSLHDAIQFERLGVPATVLITDVFLRTVASFSRTLGADGYHSVVLPHPVSSRSRERLSRLVHEAAPVARDQLIAPVGALSPAV
jgi:hypothetical protein